jgi:peptide/nickel transport system substrate-binding protein
MPIIHAPSLVTAELLRKLGLNVDLQAGDTGTFLTRRTSKESVERGGWSIFLSFADAANLATPANSPIRATGDKAWFGWPRDSKLEELRDAWFNATDAVAGPARLPADPSSPYRRR